MFSFTESDNKMTFVGTALETGMYADSFSKSPHVFPTEVIHESMEQFKGVPITIEHSGKPAGVVDDVIRTENGFDIHGTLTCPTAMEYVKQHEKLGLSIECDAELDKDAVTVTRLHDVKAISLVKTPACSSCLINSAQIENMTIHHLAMSKIEENVSCSCSSDNETAVSPVEETITTTITTEPVPEPVVQTTEPEQIENNSPEEIKMTEEKTVTGELEIALAAAQEALAQKEAEFTAYKTMVDSQFETMGAQIASINEYTEAVKAQEAAKLAELKAAEDAEKAQLMSELSTTTGVAMSAFEGMTVDGMKSMLEFSKASKTPAMGNSNEGIMAQHETVAMSSQPLTKEQRKQAIGFMVANMLINEAARVE